MRVPTTGGAFAPRVRSALAARAFASTWLALVLTCCAPPSGQDAGAEDAGAADGAMAGPTTIALYDGLGIWPDGFAALQGAITSADLPLRVVTAAEVRSGVLDDMAALVMGGGWAWDQWQGLGDDGVTAIRRFVLDGGGYLGICAGAYLASDDVVWEGSWVAYPLNLFNGTAEGPVPGLPAWPDAGTAQVARVDGAHRLQGAGALAVYYQGGGAFVPRDQTEVVPVLRYADDSLAALALEAGRGRVLLTGVHLEMEQPASGAEALTPVDNRALLLSILHWLRGS